MHAILVDCVGAAQRVVDGLLGAADPEPDELVLLPSPVAAVHGAVVEHCNLPRIQGGPSALRPGLG